MGVREPEMKRKQPRLGAETDDGKQKEQTGKLCTGCRGDLLYCLRRFGAPEPVES